MTENKANKSPQSQADKFKEAARELSCDENEARFNDALRKIGKTKALDDEPKTPKTKNTKSPGN